MALLIYRSGLSKETSEDLMYIPVGNTTILWDDPCDHYRMLRVEAAQRLGQVVQIVYSEQNAELPMDTYRTSTGLNPRESLYRFVTANSRADMQLPHPITGELAQVVIEHIATSDN